MEGFQRAAFGHVEFQIPAVYFCFCKGKNLVSIYHDILLIFCFLTFKILMFCRNYNGRFSPPVIMYALIKNEHFVVIVASSLLLVREGFLR